jgi:hypothetical protein
MTGGGPPPYTDDEVQAAADAALADVADEEWPSGRAVETLREVARAVAAREARKRKKAS